MVGHSPVFQILLQTEVRMSVMASPSVCVYSGLTSLSTIFQSYHDGVWLRQEAQCSLL